MTGVLPPYLYKYTKWDNNGYARKLISKCELYFQDYKLFNDPFDFCFVQTVTKNPDEQKKLAEQLLNNEEHSSTDNKTREELIQEMITGFNSPELTMPKSSSLGVFCLSECPKNILMWSHYGASHTGFCVQFETKHWNNGKNADPDRVKYQEDFLRYEWNSNYNETFLSFLKTAAFTKSPDWSYEREWRSISQQIGCNAHSAPLISGIILGAKCSKKDEDQIREIAREKEIAVIKAKLSKTAFIIEIPDFPG